MKAGELNRKIQYDILTQISGVNEASNVDLTASYQAREDKFPDVDCVIYRSPTTDIIESPEFSIEYSVTYENTGIDFTLYANEESLGLEVEGNGRSKKFISDFREAMNENLDIQEFYTKVTESAST